MTARNKKIVKLILNDHAFQNKEILFLKAEGSSTLVFLIGARKICISQNMQKVLELINNDLIVKTHRSYSVNMAKNPVKNDKHYLLEDGTKIPISRRQANRQNDNDDWENFRGIGCW